MTWADVPAVVALSNTAAQSTRGTDVTADHWQRRHYYDETIDLSADTCLIFDGPALVAYGEVFSEAPHVVYQVIGCVHPDYRGGGLGSIVLRWAEDRARATVDQAPAGAAVFMHSSVLDRDTATQRLLVAHGYQVVRDFVHMQIRLVERPSEPRFPAGIDVRVLEPGDWAKVGPALDEAFRDHWGVVQGDYDEDDQPDTPDYRSLDPAAFDNTYFNTRGLCFIAWEEGEVAGVCLCNGNTIEFPGSGYLGSLSVRQPYRGRGLGEALTRQALVAFYDQGIRHVLTDTDGDGLTGAFRVYQRAGMSIFRREHVLEKTIRPGHDLLRRGPSEGDRA